MLEEFIFKMSIVSGIVLFGMVGLIAFGYGYRIIYDYYSEFIYWLERELLIKKYRNITLPIFFIVLVVLWVAYTFIGLGVVVILKHAVIK